MDPDAPRDGAIDPARTGPYRAVFALAALVHAALAAALLCAAGSALLPAVIPGDSVLLRWHGLQLVLFAFLYSYATVRPSRAKPIIAFGMLGAVLGTLGWGVSVSKGDWPVESLTLLLLHGVWALPFSLFLLEGTRLRERLSRWAPLACFAANAAASLGMLLVLRPGTEVEPDVDRRAEYVSRHLVAWRAVWLLWVLAASTLVAFLGWWSARVARPRLGLAGFALAAAGVLFDATAESIFAGWMPERMDLARTAAFLSGAVANGLYCTGGLLLTVAAGPRLVGWRRAWTYATWTIGLGLTVAAILHDVPLLVAFTAATMTSFLGWLLVVGRRLA